jgi:hypothetical protein
LGVDVAVPTNPVWWMARQWLRFLTRLLIPAMKAATCDAARVLIVEPAFTPVTWATSEDVRTVGERAPPAPASAL